MNATDTIFALALASNVQQQKNFTYAYTELEKLGEIKFSSIYQIPCRDGVGADYWNSACLLQSDRSIAQIIEILKQLEQQSGRIRPSHRISLDIDVIAWGKDLNSMQFNPKKLPLALDVKIPLWEIWQHNAVGVQHHIQYPVIKM